MSTEITLHQPSGSQLAAQRHNAVAGFFDLEGFELMQRIAKAFSTSTLVPGDYRGSLANCMIALNIASRIRADPLMVMQNLSIVQGRPSWSGKFLIASVNTCGRFSTLRYEFFGEPGTPSEGCRASAVELATGEVLTGADITWELVCAEGWNKKNGSKWLTMRRQMFMYRAGAWWVNVYAPELSMGLMTMEESQDVGAGDYLEQRPQQQRSNSAAAIALRAPIVDDAIPDFPAPAPRPMAAEPVATEPVAAEPVAAVADAPEPPKPTRKRRTPSERLAEAEGRAPGNDAPAPSTAASTPSTVPASADDDGRDHAFEEEARAADGQADGTEFAAGEDEAEDASDVQAYRGGWRERFDGKPRRPNAALCPGAKEASAWLAGYDDAQKAIDLGNAPRTPEASEAMLSRAVDRHFAG